MYLRLVLTHTPLCCSPPTSTCRVAIRDDVHGRLSSGSSSADSEASLQSRHGSDNPSVAHCSCYLCPAVQWQHCRHRNKRVFFSVTVSREPGFNLEAMLDESISDSSDRPAGVMVIVELVALFCLVVLFFFLYLASCVELFFF